MEYEGASAHPQDSADSAVYYDQGADADYGQQQEYDYSAVGDPANAYNYYDTYDYSGEQQASGTGAYSGGEYAEGVYAYDPETGVYYSDGSALVDADGEPLAELSPFKDEAYWEQELYNQTPEETTETAAPTESNTNPESGDSTLSPSAGSIEAIETPRAESPVLHETSKSSSARLKASTPSSSKMKKPAKSKKERMQKRQELLEKEEEAKLQQKDGESSDASKDGSALAGGSKAPVNPAAARPPKKLTFIEREKAKIHLQIQKARAIARKRIPFQVRILTQTRQHLSPLEKYFESRSVEATLSDIFWAALKGDLRRVRHLVEVEGVSAFDNKLDPWSMRQSPLHWAAKGGSREVIEFLLQAGANARCLDENGSFPLHIACWAGHVDATLALLKAGDARDLYVHDFDAALAPLDWATIRGHTQLLKAIAKFEDSQWLPKFIEDLIRGIIRYKIKVFKPPPKPARLALATSSPAKQPEIETTAAAASAPVVNTASEQAAPQTTSTEPGATTG